MASPKNNTSEKRVTHCRSFLTAVSHDVKKVKASWEQQELNEGRRFNGVSIFDPIEVSLTRIIAKLLKPAGEHGQGGRFLEALLAQANLGSKLDASAAKVYPEHLTQAIENDLRRIDTLVCLPDYVVGIEYKPFDAPDLKNQVFDYLQYLKTIAGRRRTTLLYLSHDGDGPPPISIASKELAKAKKSGTLQVHCYSDFIKEWLCACQACCAAPRVLSFLGEFLAYIEWMSSNLTDETYMDKQETRRLITKAALESAENLEATLAIFKNFQAAWGELVARFADRLEKSLRRRLNPLYA